MGRQPGTLTQHEREAKVRAFIPGGDKELPSEIRRTSAEPESARRLLPAESAATTLQWANLSPETKRLRMMQQQISKLASKEDVKKGERVLPLGDLKPIETTTGSAAFYWISLINFCECSESL